MTEKEAAPSMMSTMPSMLCLGVGVGGGSLGILLAEMVTEIGGSWLIIEVGWCYGGTLTAQKATCENIYFDAEWEARRLFLLVDAWMRM